MNGGAVAYLTHSQYGRNGNEIAINNNLDFKTGNSEGKTSGAEATTWTFAYNTTQGMIASTTGNMTGVYDMSGGAYEYVAAWNKNASSNINSGSSFTSFGKSSTKYATAYNGDSSNAPSSSKCIVGDAIYELYEGNNQPWFSDGVGCASSSQPFFARGGTNNSDKVAGVFSSRSEDGKPYSSYSFRVSLPGM